MAPAPKLFGNEMAHKKLSAPKVAATKLQRRKVVDDSEECGRGGTPWRPNKTSRDDNWNDSYK